MSRTQIVAYNTKEVKTKNPARVYPAKSIFIPPLPSDKKLRETWNIKDIAYYDVHDIFKDFKDFKQAKHLWLSVDGGIGDIIAMSAIFEYLKDYDITVFCNPSYWPIFKWFKSHPPKLKAYNDIICHNYGIDTVMTKYKHYARINLDYAAVDADRNCWYEAMFDRIGITGGYEKRPQLKVSRISKLDSDISRFGTSILVCHKSSCQMRSSKFEDFYIPVHEKYPNHMIFVHQTDLSKEDMSFCNDKGVKIIPKCSLSDYLLNVWDADLVVGTDSAAVHMREGIGQPAVAVYGAFTAQARTSGYKYVKSFNTVSDCPYQSCFIHEQKQGEVCKNAKAGDKFAACQSGKSFQSQLLNNL